MTHGPDEELLWTQRRPLGRQSLALVCPRARAAAARRRPLGHGSRLEAAPGGSGLAWGCWAVAPAPRASLVPAARAAWNEASQGPQWSLPRVNMRACMRCK